MINVDTEQMKKCGQDIVNLSQELSEIIETLYYKIYNMPILTGEWVGDAADLFTKQANDIEKKDAIEVKNELKKFGETLIESAEKYELKIKDKI